MNCDFFLKKKKNNKKKTNVTTKTVFEAALIQCPDGIDKDQKKIPPKLTSITSGLIQQFWQSWWPRLCDAKSKHFLLCVSEMSMQEADGLNGLHADDRLDACLKGQDNFISSDCEVRLRTTEFIDEGSFFCFQDWGKSLKLRLPYPLKKYEVCVVIHDTVFSTFFTQVFISKSPLTVN